MTISVVVDCVETFFYMMSSENLRPQLNNNWERLSQFGVRRRFIDDNFYEPGNKLCQNVLGKKSIIIFDNEDFLHPK